MKRLTPEILDQLAHDPEVAGEFWARVDVVDDDDSCWLWLGPGGSRMRYGHVLWSVRGYRVYCHRYAFFAAGGVLEDGEVVLHHCHQGACQRPSHISAGTIKINNQMRDEAGRRQPPKGLESWSAKLDERDVRIVLVGREQGVPVKTLAAMVGVAPSTIYNALNGTTSYRTTLRDDAAATSSLLMER